MPVRPWMLVERELLWILPPKPAPDDQFRRWCSPRHTGEPAETAADATKGGYLPAAWLAFLEQRLSPRHGRRQGGQGVYSFDIYEIHHFKMVGDRAGIARRQDPDTEERRANNAHVF